MRFLLNMEKLCNLPEAFYGENMVNPVTRMVVWKCMETVESDTFMQIL